MIQDESGSELKLCPYCAEEIRGTAIVCRHCGRPMPGYEGRVPDPVSRGIGGSSEKGRSAGRTLIWLLLIPVALIVAIFVFGDGTLPAGLAVRIVPTATVTPVPTEQPCSVQAANFLAAIEGSFEAWDDAVVLANSTSRISLGSAVARLQELRREANGLTPPDCALSVKTSWVAYMDAMIDGFLSFMQDDSDSLVSLKMDLARQLQQNFFVDYFEIKGESLLDSLK